MDRRNFLKLLPAGIAATETLAATAQQTHSATKPNFLFFICDDLTFRSINSLNNPEVHTPNLDRLVSAGCTFTHAFHNGSWSGAVCIASRTMLNTGLTGFRAQTQADLVHTWGETLGNGGYDTYICGKWHLDPVLLGRSFKQVGCVGPAMFFSTAENGQAYNRPSPGNTWQPDDKSQKGHWLPTDMWKNEAPGRIEHSDSVYADIASEYLKSRPAHGANPFFMYVGFNSPHDPRQAPKEILDLYPQDKIEIPPNYLPDHPFDQGDNRVRDELLAPFPRTKEAVQLHRREYYALITYMDSQIGRILDTLEQSGHASNTYVILTADHGLAVGQHGLLGKQNLYDCSVRMPLLISGPGIPRGRRVDELVYQHSMFATTCDLAGIPIPKTVEFPSLVPLLHGETELHDAVFSFYLNFQRSVRDRRHKLIVYPKVNQVQLFDIVADPWETKNLADDPSMAEVKQKLFARLQKFQVDLGDTLALKPI